MPNYFYCKLSACFPYFCVACWAFHSVLTYIILFEFLSNLVKKTGDKSDCHHFAGEETEAPRSQGWELAVALCTKNKDFIFAAFQKAPRLFVSTADTCVRALV